MAKDGKEPKGRDLSQGIGERELEEGGKLVGHVDGEPVLLARVDGEVFGIGAKCTHYGGPLEKGLIVGHTVRCPWHHACFSLRTGEMLRPPALADLPRYQVERKDGRIRVLGKEKAKREVKPPVVAPSSVVIVGAGAAGNAAAETLRRDGYAGRVTLVDPDPGAPYDRPNLSKDYLAGKAPESWIPLHSTAFYEKSGIEFVREDAVSIDTQARRLELANGSALSWDVLLLAPGAEPRRMNLPTAPGAKVFTLRSLEDSRAIIAASESARQAAVIGGGFIGLEVAAALRQRGLVVHAVVREQSPLGHVMGPDLASFIKNVHEEHGVQFHLGRSVKHIDERSIALDDGTRLDTDFVVVGIGVTPRVGLAEAAGLTLDNGIAVNEFLETSQPGIWAAGDVASWPDPHTGQRIRVEHWVLAERMGQQAAKNILGANERFNAVPFFWSQHYDDVIAYVGHGTGWDEAKLDGDPAQRDCAVTFSRGGKRLAVATIYRDVESLQTEVAMEQRVSQHLPE